MAEQPVIEVESVVTRFGSETVHRGISFSIPRGQVVALIGGSGSGKTTLLKEMLSLQRPTSGRIALFGQDIVGADEQELSELRKRFGVLFQYSALFSGLSAGDNVAIPLREQLKLPETMVGRLVALRLSLAGLDSAVAGKMPSELSGGMKKRVALARALALEPELLFLDEPTSGLDPIGARSFDNLVRTLCDGLGLTVFMVTHDLDSILSIADRVIVLDKGVLIADGPPESVRQVDHPWIRSYFSSRSTGSERVRSGAVESRRP
jgi:phospholipid/cholesterol/gamma-HCH transport system ATP-binding protein